MFLTNIRTKGTQWHVESIWQSTHISHSKDGKIVKYLNHTELKGLMDRCWLNYLVIWLFWYFWTFVGLRDFSK